MSRMSEVTAKIKEKAFKTWNTFPLGSKRVEVVILSVVEKVLGELEKTHVVIEKKQLRKKIKELRRKVKNKDDGKHVDLSYDYPELLRMEERIKVYEEFLGVKSEKELLDK